MRTKQFFGVEGDFGEEIDQFLQDNQSLRLIHLAQVVAEDSEKVVRPALVGVFADPGDPIVTGDFKFAATTPAGFPPAPIDIDEIAANFPCATEETPGKVRVSVNQPTPDADCSVVLSEDDPRIASSPRQAGKGSTVIGNNTTVTAGVIRRTPGFVISVFSFIEDDDAGLIWSQNGSTASGTASLRFRRTAAADTLELRIENRTGQSITVKWVVLEVPQV